MKLNKKKGTTSELNQTVPMPSNKYYKYALKDYMQSKNKEIISIFGIITYLQNIDFIRFEI